LATAPRELEVNLCPVQRESGGGPGHTLIMNDPSEKFTEQATAFQKIWSESMSRLIQAAFTFSPDSPPPELIKQIRSTIFEALAKSWEEFLRSPQFLEGTRQWMDNAVAFRKMSNDFMGKMRNEMQAPSREDIDSILLAVRHMETRILDRVEQLAAEIKESKSRPKKNGRTAQGRSKAPGKRPRKINKGQP
jgi:hypothetical protein